MPYESCLKEFLSSTIKKDGTYPICDGKNDSKSMQEFGNISCSELIIKLILSLVKHVSFAIK